MTEPTVEEMAEYLATNTTNCPSQVAKTGYCDYLGEYYCFECWKDAPESEIRTRYAEMKGEKHD